LPPHVYLYDNLPTTVDAGEDPMKKNENKEKLKKLRLSKETLRSLTIPEMQMAAGASLGISCQSNCPGVCPVLTIPSEVC
jgi:hypothetical protein